jgi:hypothetical protein
VLNVSGLLHSAERRRDGRARKLDGEAFRHGSFNLLDGDQLASGVTERSRDHFLLQPPWAKSDGGSRFSDSMRDFSDRYLRRS